MIGEVVIDEADVEEVSSEEDLAAWTWAAAAAWAAAALERTLV